jgi:hypothetical protein
MVARLATIPSVDRRAIVPARTVLAVDHQSVRPFRGRVPRDRPVLECRWRIEPSGRLACVWSVVRPAPRLSAGPAPQFTSPPIQPVGSRSGTRRLDCGEPALDDVDSLRQWRNRLAGLRTNTLVALGAASFVVFAALVPGETSPTRVAAQVVSGIGFIGAGLIFGEGLTVRGLNTAATLWCSAAVGLLAGGARIR